MIATDHCGARLLQFESDRKPAAMNPKTIPDRIPSALQVPDVEREGANSITVLTARARGGQLAWAGPLVMVAARSFFLIAAQAVVAGLLWIQSGSWSWNAAAKWWTVYGTLVDLGCLALMRVFVRQEGIRLRDLIGRVRLRRGYDFFLGIGCYLLIFPFFALAFPLAGRIVYGRWQPHSFPGLMDARVLPLWAVVYSLSVWWMIWSPTEQMTYQGYALPRLVALFGSRSKAILLVGFWWALQHSFLPFILDWRYVAWRFLAFVPGTMVFMLVYLRLRRLPPLIVAHWPMDIAAAFFTVRF
jgi:hypothetical protein